MPLISVDFKPIIGAFIRRINRFMVLAEVRGEHVLAHLPNSGRLITTLYQGAKLYLRRFNGAHSRKSAYSVFAASYNNDITIIVDAHFSNKLAREVIDRGLMGELLGYRIVRENVKLVGSKARLDFLLRGHNEEFYLEVKSVTHAISGVALFPDAPTLRGRRQLIELNNILRSGSKAGLLFSVQRPDAFQVKPNYEADPKFASLLKASMENGLRILTLKSIFIPGEGVFLQPYEPPFSF